MDLLRYLFAGKLTLQDVMNLEPHFISGALVSPRWLPPWMQHVHGLAGKLAFSLFINRIRMSKVEAETLSAGV
jgi:hypothetical protein